jgi:hypothetical protein
MPSPTEHKTVLVRIRAYASRSAGPRPSSRPRFTVGIVFAEDTGCGKGSNLNLMEASVMATKKRADDAADLNRDPITGEPGAHPVGTGVGAAVGGGAAGAALGAAGAAAAAGGAVGAAAGPIGAVVGAVAGGIAGGLAGKDIAELINPTEEDAFWRANYRGRPYVDSGAAYDDYQAAYRYGWESRARHHGRRFDDVEAELRSGWEKTKAKSRLGWEKAKGAVRDAWDRVENALTDRAPQARRPR